MKPCSVIEGYKVLGLAVANALLMGAALFTSNPKHYGAVAIAVGMFIAVVFVVSQRWAKSSARGASYRVLLLSFAAATVVDG
jgi:hypothetical protein